MDMIRNIVAFAAVMILVVSVSAKVNAHVSDGIYEIYNYDESDIALTDIIIDAMKKRKTDPIDVSEFNKSFDEFEKIYTNAILNEPEILDVSIISANLKYKNESHILAFSPVYTCTESERSNRQHTIDNYTNLVLSGVCDEWSDAEKVLYIHDCLASRITYYDGVSTKFGRSIYDAFIKKSAVCVGYALGFQYFMEKLDIRCINVVSETHIWSMVNIDGEWYNVDVTWDDSTEVTGNFLRHNVLLSSDSEMYSAGDHDKAERSESADDETYKNGFWKKSNCRIVYLDGYWYYTTKDGLYRYSTDSRKSTRIYSIKKPWVMDKERIWSVGFSQPVIYGKNVYFNTRDKIYRFDTVKKKIVKICSPDMAQGYQIYDMELGEGKLIFYCGTADEPTRSKKSIKLNAA